MERVEYESLIIQDLIGYHDREELNIAPWYQRRIVWSQPQKAYLINTIHENKPVPSIYIRHDVDLDSEKSIKEIVDGQQRVRCVIEYRNDGFPAKHPNHTVPVFYSDMSRSERIHFLQSSLSVGYLVGASDSDVIEIFARINSVSKTINQQERRNAKYSGEFKQFCLNESIKRLSFWRNNNIFTDIQISRMLEVQFVSDLIINFIEGLQDYSSKKIDVFYQEYEASFPQSKEIEERLDRVYTILLGVPNNLIRNTIFSAPQLLFSLILILDGDEKPALKVVRNCVIDLDGRVEAVRSGENPQALEVNDYAAFAAGNLHRIRSRRLRDALIKSYFS